MSFDGFVLRSFCLALSGLISAGAHGAWFEDQTQAAGIDFRYLNGAEGRFWFPEIMGGGAAALDFDGDGRQDLYLVQGGAIGPGIDRSVRQAGDRLLRNVTEPGGALRFVDVTGSAGIDARGYGQGVAIGDVDRDGDADIYVLNFGPNELWRNNGDGTFSNVTDAAGVGDPGWSVSASFADLDGDGLLDLYVINYVDYAFDRHRDCRAAGSGRLDYCSPSAYAPASDRLYRNLGDGSFADVSESAGISPYPQPGLGVITADFDRDGRLDVYVANDGEPNQLWLNQGEMRFVDDALLAGNAVNAGGAAEAGMGVDAADFDRNGALDIFLTHLVRETNTLYANDGKGWFTDVTAAKGLGTPSLPKTGFGTAFVDFDLDGWLDLFVVNGGVTIEADRAAAGDPFPYHQTDQLFRNEKGRFTDLSAAAGAALAEPHTGRGAAFADFDNDGRVDIVTANNNGPAKLLRTVAGDVADRVRGWVGLTLQDGQGRMTTHAEVWLLNDDGEPHWLHRSRTDGSYASANDARIVFGLPGGAGEVGVQVNWPDGLKERFTGLTTGRYHAVRRASGQAMESP